MSTQASGRSTLAPAGAMVLAALTLIAGCGAKTASPSPPPAAEAKPEKPGVEPAVTVTMLQGNYEPKEVRIKAGQAVKWWNNDTEVHGPLVLYRDGDFAQRVASNSGPFHPNATWTYVFEEPGRYLLKDRAATLDVVMEQWVYVEP